MTNIQTDVELIAKCGLYCGACSKLKKGKCPGCLGNEKASKWCKVRTCCLDNNFTSCAECKEFSNIMECKKYNNFIAKLFGFVFNSDRNACIQEIKEKGYEEFAKNMAQNDMMSFKRKGRRL